MCLKNLNSDDAVVIEKYHRLLKNSFFEENVINIQSNFEFVLAIITRLNSFELLFVKSNINNRGDKINKFTGISNKIFRKFKTVFEKNIGCKTLCQISKLLNGKMKLVEGIDKQLIAKNRVL